MQWGGQGNGKFGEFWEERANLNNFSNWITFATENSHLWNSSCNAFENFAQNKENE